MLLEVNMHPECQDGDVQQPKRWGGVSGVRGELTGGTVRPKSEMAVLKKKAPGFPCWNAGPSLQPFPSHVSICAMSARPHVSTCRYAHAMCLATLPPPRSPFHTESRILY